MPTDPTDLTSQLEKLSELHKDGSLTSREFSQAKKKLLDSSEQEKEEAIEEPKITAIGARRPKYAADARERKVDQKVTPSSNKTEISEKDDTLSDSKTDTRTEHQKHLRTDPTKDRQPDLPRAEPFNIPPASPTMRRKGGILFRSRSANFDGQGGKAPADPYRTSQLMIIAIVVFIFGCFAYSRCTSYERVDQHFPHGVDKEFEQLKEQHRNTFPHYQHGR